MKKIKHDILMIILLLIYGSGISFSQEKSYTLENLIQLAINSNTDILVARGDSIIVSNERTQAVSNILPELNAEGSYIYSSKKNGIPVFAGANGKNEVFALLSLRQTIFDPDVISNLRTSSIKTDEQKYLNEEIKQNVISQVIEQYFTVLKYKNEEVIYSKNLEAFRLIHEQSRLLFEAGSVPEIDVKKSKVELLLQKNTLNQAKKNYNRSLSKLKELVGMRLDDKLPLHSFDISKIVLDSLELYKNAVWQNRPDWRFAEKESEIGKINMSRAFMKHLPTVSGNLFYGWDAISKLNKDNLGLQAIVSVSLPLFHWGAISAENQIAEIHDQQIDYKKRRLELIILQEIENNYNEAKVQKEQISATEESIAEAKLAVKMANTGYKEGIITSLDLNNVQKLYTQAEVEYLKALYNFYLAKVNLFKSIGKLKEDLSWIEE